MPRKSVEQFSITVGITRSAQGYEWVKTIDAVRHQEREVIRARGTIQNPEEGVIRVFGGLAVTEHRKGRDVAHEAFLGFVSLSKRLVPPRPEMVFFHDPDLEVQNQARQANTQRMFYDAAKQDILAYANRFGLLWAPDDSDLRRNGSVESWVREAEAFRDMYEIAIALQRGKTISLATRLDKRILASDDVDANVWFIGQSGRRYRVSGKGDHIENRGDENDEIVVIDYHAIASGPNIRQKLEMILAQTINRKLSSELSLIIGRSNFKSAIISPDNLSGMLWLTLYKHTVAGDPLTAGRSCRECGKELPINSTSRKTYCDDTCRTTYNNRNPVKATRSED